MQVQEIFEGINPNVRKYFYYIYGLLGVAIGATQVGYSAAELSQPVWLTVSLAVFGFVGAAFGITAGQNVATRFVEPIQDADDTDIDYEEADDITHELNEAYEQPTGRRAAE